jgi:SAM-dependent methyltransferase
VSRTLARLAARTIRATGAIDAAYRHFDSVRSMVVARFAPDTVLDAFNDITYGATDVYKPDAPIYRSGLFNWEGEAIGRAFPSAPARVLVGGAGGGREAFALADRGYDVVAFDPSERLVESMAAHASTLEAGRGRVDALLGRYEDLPRLRTAGAESSTVDLRQRPPFDAALLGWASYSHLRQRQHRILALRQIGALTAGPVLVSFYLGRDTKPRTRRSRLARRLGFDGLDRFTTHIGYYHLSMPDELRHEAREAGLQVLVESLDDSDGRWPYLVLRRSESSDQKSAAGIVHSPTEARSGESRRT